MVQVMSGKDKGLTGKVVAVDHEKQHVTVEGVNLVYKHVRPSQRNPQGGRLQIEMPIPSSNVMVLCPRTNQPTRIGFRYLDDGSKERFAVKSGASLGVVSPPKKTYAKS